MRTIKIYGTGAANANAVAQVTIPVAATIKSVQYSILVDQSADNSKCQLELSKSPVSEIATNGAQNGFFEAGVYENAATGGQYSLVGKQTLNVKMKAGEIIYLHAAVTTSTYYFTAILEF